jgi:serine/threonine protein phosphatase 1
VLYAIGDIHGRRDKLDALLGALDLRPGDRLVFLGDYVDRGSDSRAVVDRLIDLARERPCVFLMGNHESMFLDFIGWQGRNYFGREVFLANGGSETLLSYGFDAIHPAGTAKPDLPSGHEVFFRSLRLSHLEGDYLFVHAGLGRALASGADLGWALRQAGPEELLWDRSTVDAPHELGVTIVYGHTPSPDFQVRWNPPYSIGIDTGAVYGGPLTAIRLPGETLVQV